MRKGMLIATMVMAMSLPSFSATKLDAEGSAHYLEKRYGPNWREVLNKHAEKQYGPNWREVMKKQAEQKAEKEEKERLMLCAGLSKALDELSIKQWWYYRQVNDISPTMTREEFDNYTRSRAIRLLSSRNKRQLELLSESRGC